MNAVYGSELHLLRYLGRHRDNLNQRVLGEVGGTAVDWLDFGFDLTPDDARRPNQPWDAELKALDWLTDRPEVRDAWARWWPQTPGTVTWDAVGRVTREGIAEWVLVEAKGNVQELSQNCKARVGPGLSTIRESFSRTKKALGVDPARNWEVGYYQYANRIATLQFLTECGVTARLLFIYFTGDRNPKCDCPATANAWYEMGLKRMKESIGLPEKHSLSARIHELFVPVRGVLA